MEKANTAKFEYLEHTADLKIKIFGGTLAELFENAASALSKYISSEKDIKTRKAKIVEVQGIDINSLLYNFFEELIFLIDAENFAVAKASVNLRGNNLRAELSGDNASKYSLKQIKAPTYAEMYIKKIKNSWEAQVVLDV
jgi:SHS2 domain-containing protein